MIIKNKDIKKLKPNDRIEYRLRNLDIDNDSHYTWFFYILGTILLLNSFPNFGLAFVVLGFLNTVIYILRSYKLDKEYFKVDIKGKVN